MTNTTSGMVIPVSAIFVAKTICKEARSYSNSTALDTIPWCSLDRADEVLKVSFKGAVEGAHFQFWSQKFRLFCSVLLIYYTVSSVHFNEIVRLKIFNFIFSYVYVCSHTHECQCLSRSTVSPSGAGVWLLGSDPVLCTSRKWSTCSATSPAHGTDRHYNKTPLP